MVYLPNLGRLPPECEIRDEHGEVTGFRLVHVRLFNGHCTKTRGQPPWPSADGRPRETRWQISRPPHEFQIEFYEVV